MARLNSSNVLVPWVLMDEQPLLDETTSPKSEKTSWLKERNSSNMWPKLIMRIKVICHKCTKSYVTHLFILPMNTRKVSSLTIITIIVEMAGQIKDPQDSINIVVTIIMKYYDEGMRTTPFQWCRIWLQIKKYITNVYVFG